MKDLSFYLPGTNGKAVLLIHGLTGAPAEMRPVGRILNRKGYTVYAPLLAGHGLDEKTLVKTCWEDWLAGLVPAIDRLTAETDHVYAAGICVGGKLAMMLAHTRPRSLRATAIYSACFNYDGWDTPSYYKLAPFVPLWVTKLPLIRNLSFAETGSMGIKSERLRRWMSMQSSEGVLDKFPALALAEMFRLGHALKKALPNMQTPNLILHAREDDLSNIRNAEYINQHIAAPHEMHVLENSYHMIHVDQEYGKTADLTDQFFSRYANA